MLIRALPVIMVLLVVGLLVYLSVALARQRVLTRQARRKADRALGEVAHVLSTLDQLVEDPLTDLGTRQMLELARSEIKRRQIP